MTQTQTAALDAAVMRAVSLASSVKAFAAAKEIRIGSPALTEPGHSTVTGSGWVFSTEYIRV